MRRGRLFVPRLQPMETGVSPVVKSAHGLSILTGGLSPLALTTAEWLAREGIKDIWLVARRKPTPAERVRLAGLEACGVQVTLWDDVDLGDRSSLERVLQAAVNEGRAISSIFHFAGHLEDAPLVQTDAALLQRVFAPKVPAAQTLLDWLERLKPGSLVFASSAATVFGQHGQTAHATANAILEGLADQARSAGWPVQALALGYWDDGRAERNDLARLFADQGMLGLDEDEGLALLRQALDMQERLEEHGARVHTLRLLGHCLAGQGDSEAAQRCHTQAEQLSMLLSFSGRGADAAGGPGQDATATLPVGGARGWLQ